MAQTREVEDAVVPPAVRRQAPAAQAPVAAPVLDQAAVEAVALDQAAVALVTAVVDQAAAVVVMRKARQQKLKKR